jgi:N utilization substance protein B
MLQKEKFRELVFAALYSLGFYVAKQDEKESAFLVESLMQLYKVTASNSKKAVHFAKEILQEQDRLDGMIEEASKSFHLSRIQSVERAIIRLIFYELFIEKKLPVAVAISEAGRLARKFASDEAALFIHALIDRCNSDVR